MASLLAVLSLAAAEVDDASLLQRMRLSKSSSLSPTYNYSAPWLLPEGIDTLPDGDFVLGSMSGQGLTRAKIADGEIELSSFAAPQEAMTSVVGVHVDKRRKRVLAVNAPAFQGTFANTSGVAGIWAFNLKGEVQCFGSFGDNVGASPNDLTVDRRGKIYSTDPYNGHIWKTSKDCRRSEILLTLPNAGTQGKQLDEAAFANGIDRIPRSAMLLASVVYGGLYRIKIRTREYVEVLADQADMITAIDGLVVTSRTTAYGVDANRHAVVKMTTRDKFKSVTTQLSRPTVCATPTTLTVKDGDIWVTCVNNFGEGPYAIEKIVFDA